MTNFDFLKNEPQFAAFADTAIAAEKTLGIDANICVQTCRSAMEFAVKWMYSADSALETPYDGRLNNLINNEDFRDIAGDDIWRRLDYIRKCGNKAVHDNSKRTEEEALLCLENLFVFTDFLAYCYGEDYSGGEFDAELCKSHSAGTAPVLPAIDLEALKAENAELREQLTAQRIDREQTYVKKPLELSEYKTRKLYIDVMLRDAGWTEGRDWLNEVELPGMPNKSEVGYADYVLYGDDGRPLAVVEAKRTCIDVSKGRQQAKLYADILEKKFGRRPVIFLTNGFETRITDNVYPERKVSNIYSKRDLEKLFNLQKMRESLANVMVNKDIAGRYYQEGAIKAVCDTFDNKHRRKALLVMATGSGKTRTVVGLCDVLLKKGWVKNILFLADRNALVTQAKRSFVNLLPELSVTNLCEDKDNYNAHCVFSTYPTMMNCIDSVHDEEGKLFTCGHFDLIICDEAHRSIYNKYRDIFTYFDAPLVGLTATPKDEIDKNTYEIFELGNGSPTYGYELAQAVQDGYLVDFLSVETELKFLTKGIVYDELSDEDKEQYENTFVDEDGDIPEKIAPSALNNWVMNTDTIKKALNLVMTQGLKIDYGQKIGKTIIFAANHNHAERILEIFNSEYPKLAGYAKVIDNRINYAQSLIDEFSDPKKLPQIAISVDMLDTGIDVPEILNLVFFKKVMSKAKFWQMIGRGTRLCPNLIDGVDKNKFYIFDFCGNFEFFRMNKGKATPNLICLQGAVWSLKFQMAYKLQDIAYQTDYFISLRKSLVDDMAERVRELNRDNFAVKQHLKYVEQYSDIQNYSSLKFEDTLIVADEIAPLILPYDDDPKAVRFDALIYGIELSILAGKAYSRRKTDLYKKVSAVASVGNIPEITAQKDLIDRILNTDLIERGGIEDFENIREKIRGLIKYIPVGKIIYETNFDDEIMDPQWNESQLDNDDLKGYKYKAEEYIRKHQDEAAIAKLKTNQPLNAEDVAALEKILWSNVGTHEDYANEYGDKPLGEFVRGIVGLDMNAAKEAFSVFLNNTALDSKQIYFVNQIVEYIVRNGVMKDLSILQESPFTDNGSVVEIFSDLSIWQSIKKAIESINNNAVA